MQNSRTVTRVSLIVVLVIGLIGGWYAAQNWVPGPSFYDLNAISEQTDWIDLIAGIGEEALQLVLGLTSGGE